MSSPERSAHALDRSSHLPLWVQLAAELRRRAACGDFDDQVDTEEQLTETYMVSRHTVRQALHALEEGGLLERRQGKGTYLRGPRFDQPLHGLYSLATTITGHGAREHSRVLALRRSRARAKAGALGLAPQAPLVYIERLRIAGDEPLALDRSWLPEELSAPLLDADLSSGSLYGALESLCSVRVTGGRERIWPVNPAERDRELLELPRGLAAFAVERLALSGDRPVEWRESLVRGDRYSFSVEWPSGIVPALAQA